MNVQFNIWSSYKITALQEGSETILGLPSEYYNYLAWQTAVDGFGGGGESSENPNAWVAEWQLYIIIGIVVVVGAVGLYIYLKIRKKGMGMSNITINTK